MKNKSRFVFCANCALEKYCGFKGSELTSHECSHFAEKRMDGTARDPDVAKRIKEMNKIDMGN